MKIIGITGGVGSGKSEVLNILKNDYNAHIIIADLVAHKLFEKGNISYNLIVDYFGERILNEEKIIDRKKLANIVFNDKLELEKLNSFVHPYVKEYIKKEIKEIRLKGQKSLIVIEAALLIEDGYKNICDELWYVYVSEENRFKRLKESRGYTDEKILAILKNQLSDLEFRKNCSFTIDNDGDITDTKECLKLAMNSGIH